MEIFSPSDPRKGRPSASGLEQMFLCRGSWLAQKGFPELPSDASDSGVRIHAALAGDVRELEKLSSDELTVYEHMQAEASRLVDLHDFDPNRFVAEERIYFPDEEVPEFSGQPDRAYLNGPRSLVLDAKSGFLPVTTASENPQLAAQAILAIHRFGVSEVTVAILPRFGRVKETAAYNLDSATKALDFIRQIISEAEKPDAPRKAGDKQCRYCRFKLQCPEFKAYTDTALALHVDSLPTLPADQLAAAIDRIPMANALIEALKAEGKCRLAAGDEEFSKLYTLTEGRSLKTITDIVALYKRCKELGIDDSTFTQQCTIDFGAVDGDGNGKGLKLLLHRACGVKGKALDAKFKEVIAGLVDERRSQGSLKRKETA